MKKLLLFLIGGIVLICVLSPLFIKIKIECKSQYGECPSEINSKLVVLNSKSLFVAKGQLSTILKKELLVYAFSSQFRLPNRLEVSLLVKKPVFAIMDVNSNKFGLVDDGGTILSTSDSTLLPAVRAGGEIKAGSKVGAPNLFALKLIQGLNEMYQIKTGQITGDSLLVELPGPIRVIFPLDGDVQVLLGETRIVYMKVMSPELSGKYSEIDLRFKNPVLR